MAEDEESVRPDQDKQEASQDSPRKIVAEIDDVGCCRILLTPEEHVRCTTDREFLKKVLLQASIENGNQSSTIEVEVKKEETSPGTAGLPKWTDERIKMLLSMVAELTPHKKDNIERKAAWETMAERLKEHGHIDTYFGVSKKWANLKDRYKIILERLTKASDDSMVSWPYFEAIDKILGWRERMPSRESVKPPKEVCFLKPRNPITVDSDLTNIIEKPKERKGTKRKCGQISGRSQKRYQRRKNTNAENASSAPNWLTAYMEERNEEEERWLMEFSNCMSERNKAILSLAATIAEFRKQ